MGQLSTTMQSYSVCCYNCSEFLFAPLHRRNLIFKKKEEEKPTNPKQSNNQLFSRALGSLCSLVKYKCIIRDHTCPHFPPVFFQLLPCKFSQCTAAPHAEKQSREILEPHQPQTNSCQNSRQQSHAQHNTVWINQLFSEAELTSPCTALLPTVLLLDESGCSNLLSTLWA